VRLPYEELEEINPPTAAHVEAVYRLLVPAYRLPLLWLDWSGARVASIDTLRVGDYDERDRRIRLRASTTKTRQALWVELPDVLADALEASLAPREDRDADARLFPGVSGDRLRTAIARACKASGVPGVFAARSAAPPDLAPAPAGALVGGDRTVRRPTESEHHRGHVQPRDARRGGTRLRRDPVSGSDVVPGSWREPIYVAD
jgi:hypothetical protein